MGDLNDLVFEYRQLFTKTIDSGLDNSELTRLNALEKLFGREPGQIGADRRHARCDVDIVATIKINGYVQPVHVVNLGGGGVSVSPAPKLRTGESATLRIVRSDQSAIYQYPVKAGWVSKYGSSTQMGLPFVGIPSKLPAQRLLHKTAA